VSITQWRTSRHLEPGGDESPHDARSLAWHRRQQIWMMAVILLLLDGLLLAANAAHSLSNEPHEPVTRFTPRQWDGTDGSLIEIFGHMQLIAAAVMLGFLVASRRSLVYAAWSFALLVVVLDDFLMIHEDVGGRLAVAMGLEPVAGLQTQDLGELLVWAVLGAVMASMVILTTLRASGEDRRNSLVLVGWFGVLAVFAVGIDQLHSVVEPHVHHLFAAALTVTEVAGELIAMTLIVMAIHRMTLYQRAPALADATTA
jgi:hypothetical protein